MRIADSHTDYLAYSVLGERGGHVFDHAGMERFRRGGVSLANLAIWSPPDVRDVLACSLSQIAFLYRLLRTTPDAHLCTRPEHMERPGIGFLLSVEGGESIGCSAERIAQFYRYGVRMMSLTWNQENGFASGALCQGGLKPAGRGAIHRVSRLNMALDLSHMNETGFWQALELCDMPPCASHSCVYELCPNPRNLRKEQIVALIERRGYIGVTFFTEFLTGREATADDVIDHIDYILNCGGEDAVGLGSDFCGMSSAPAGLATASDFQAVPEAMARRGYSAALIEKICYGNFARYILQFLKRSTEESI
jgi:membrane dipeptidase